MNSGTPNIMKLAFDTDRVKDCFMMCTLGEEYYYQKIFIAQLSGVKLVDVYEVNGRINAENGFHIYFLNLEEKGVGWVSGCPHS